jgi:hypothetical protein
MEQNGFHQDGHVHNDGPCYALNWEDPGIMTGSIAEGPVKIGVGHEQLYATWERNHGRKGWIATGYHADISGDHVASLCGYGTIDWLANQLGAQVPAGVDKAARGYAIFSWNSIGIIDDQSMRAITTEAWLRRPTTIII